MTFSLVSAVKNTEKQCFIYMQKNQKMSHRTKKQEKKNGNRSDIVAKNLHLFFKHVMKTVTKQQATQPHRGCRMAFRTVFTLVDRIVLAKHYCVGLGSARLSPVQCLWPFYSKAQDARLP